MRIDPRQLTVLLAVSRAGSLSAAAREIGLSQPGVSAAIAQLERSMGARLLDRGRHGAGPTEAGKLLIRRAEAIEALIGQARREVELQLDGVTGPARIAGTPGALMSLVPAALRQMRLSIPRFEIEIREARDWELIGLLRDRKADLTISTIGIEAPPDDIQEHLILQDAFELVLARDHALISNVMSLEEIRSLPWVLPAAKGSFRRQIDALFMTNAVALPQDVILCDSLATTKQIIRLGEYVTLLPRRVVAPELEGGDLRTITLSQSLVPLKLGVRHLQIGGLSILAQAFLKALLPDNEHIG